MRSKQWGRLVGGAAAILVFLGAWFINERGLVAWQKFPTVEGGFYSQPLTYQGQQAIIPPDEIFKATRNAETTPALVNPKMIPVSAVTADYFESVPGIAVEINGDARFYSLQILNWHEIVQDTVGGTPITVTYSTLCGSAAVYKDTGPVTLAGQVYNNCSLLKDEAGNTWLQALGLQVIGQAPGSEWQRVSSELVLFEDWYQDQPNGSVLSLQTGYDRIYSRHPFGGYDAGSQLIYPLNHRDAVVGLKDSVFDVLSVDGQRLNIGVSKDFLSKEVVLQAEAGGQPVVAFMNKFQDTVQIFSARVNNQTLSWTLAPGGMNFIDDQTQSVWNSEGLAIEGELKGQRLMKLGANHLFGFAYVALAPTAILPGYTEAAAATAPEAELSGQTLQVEDGIVTIE
jgi:hypothetical protein